MQLWTCDGQGPQHWSLTSAGQLQALGKCLDTTGTGAGSLLEINDCNGAAGQTWGLGDAAFNSCIDAHYAISFPLTHTYALGDQWVVNAHVTGIKDSFR